MKESSSSINYDAIDILKIILAFNIIQIHSSFYFDWMKPLVRIAVPVYFITSAFFFFKKDPNAKQLWDYIKRLLWLYAFWFIVWAPYFFFSNRQMISPISIDSLQWFAKKFLFSSTWAASWYIMASIIGTTIIWLLKKFLNKNVLIIFGLVIYSVVVFGTTFHDFFSSSFGLIDDFWVKATSTHLSISFPVSLVWIIWGGILSESINLSRKWQYLALCLVSFALLEVEYYLCKPYFVCDDSFLMLVPVSIGLFCFAASCNIKVNTAKTLRKISTITYCSHYTIIGLCSTALFVCFGYELNSFFKMLIAVMGSLLISGLILFLEKKKCFKFLQFAH